ncbi:MAG: divergent polysaccharide deacetylase family protein, partial [Sneathiella sp.]
VVISTEQTEVIQEPEPAEPNANNAKTTEPPAQHEKEPLPTTITTPEPEASSPSIEPDSAEEEQPVTEEAPVSSDIMQEPASSILIAPEAPVQENRVIQPAETELEEELPVSGELPASSTTSENPEASPETGEPAEEQSALAAGTEVEVAVEPEASPEETLPLAASTEQPPQATNITPQVDVITEETIAEEATPLFQKFAAPFDNTDGRPRIAIVLSDVGMNAARTREAIEILPATITFAINPYGNNLQHVVDEARREGHEVLLQLPMEPKGYPKVDPGPQALRTDLDEAENRKRLDWTLGRITGYVGLTNQMGSKLTADAASITLVLRTVKKNGLLYLDSRTASDSVAADIARELEIPVAINNRFLDHKADGDLIDIRLEELEKIARQSGSSVGIAYPHRETFQHLLDWANTLDKKGLVLAPVSALIEKQEIE